MGEERRGERALVDDEGTISRFFLVASLWRRGLAGGGGLAGVVLGASGGSSRQAGAGPPPLPTQEERLLFSTKAHLIEERGFLYDET
jgi:hypothetical protein